MAYNECGSCMCFDYKKSKRIAFIEHGWCKKFQCWRRLGQIACSAYVGPGGCFLTSACVQHKGLSDDCEELTVLRNFRDNYLKSSSDGRALVDKYYAIAPTLVSKIDKRSDKDEIYEGIYKTVLNCVDLIRNEAFEEAVKAYSNMVKSLECILN